MQDDVDSNSDGDDDIEAEGGDRERFDRELPGRHDYLGEGREVRGVGEVEDLVSLPLFSQMHISLMPGTFLQFNLLVSHSQRGFWVPERGPATLFLVQKYHPI